MAKVFGLEDLVIDPGDLDLVPSGELDLGAGSAPRWRIVTGGSYVPLSNGAYNLGSSTLEVLNAFVRNVKAAASFSIYTNTVARLNFESDGDIKVQAGANVIFPNANWLKWINAAGDAQFNILSVNASNYTLLARPSGNPIIFQPGGTSRWSMSGVGNDFTFEGAGRILGASNNQYLMLCGGAGQATSNGAVISLVGNSYVSGPGTVNISTGTDAASHIKFYHGNTSQDIAFFTRDGLELKPSANLAPALANTKAHFRIGRFGYSPTYRCLMIGNEQTGGAGGDPRAISIAFNYDVSNVAGGGFSGHGYEIFFRNETTFKTPKADETNFVSQIKFDEGHQIFYQPEIRFFSSAQKLVMDSDDGADNQYLSFGGGGDIGGSRGAWISLYGNEHAGVGRAYLACGNNASAWTEIQTPGAQPIYFVTNGQTRYAITSTGDIQCSGTSTMRADTADGSDNQGIYICGGGSTGTDRGARLAVFGNEYGGAPGYAQLLSGNTAGSEIQFYCPTGGAWKIDSSGHYVPFADNSYDIGSTLAGVKDLYVTNRIMAKDGSLDFEAATTLASGSQFFFHGKQNQVASTGSYSMAVLRSNIDDINIASGITNSGWVAGLNVTNMQVGNGLLLGTLNQQIALRLRVGSHVTDTGTGTINDSMGIRIECIDDGTVNITNMWGIYQSGPAGTKNYFGSDIQNPAITADRVVITDSNNVLTESTVTAAELASLAGGVAIPAGTIVSTGRSTAPSGWLLCDGASVSQATYASLYTAIGVTYGDPGGGNFNLPDLRQRFPLGKAASGTGSTLGGTGGAIDHTHSTPAHYHGMGTGATFNIASSGSHSHIMNHGHTASSNSTGAHTHTITHNHAAVTSGSGGAHTVSISIDHNHAAVTSGSGGAHTVSINVDHDHASVTSGTDAHYHFVSNTSSVSSSGNDLSSTTYMARTSTASWGSTLYAYALQGTSTGPSVGRTNTDTHSHSVNLPNYNVANRTHAIGSHTHSVDLPNYDTTNRTHAIGSHTHSVDLPSFSGSSGSDGAHSHTITVNDFSGSATSSSHSHASGDFAGNVGLVTGGVDGNAAMTSGTQNPPFQVVNYMIKT